MKTGPTQPRNPWVQLYEARRMYAEPEARPPGRPPSIVPRSKVGLTLSKGEITELEVWQERFSTLLDRKVSIGETVGILSRICTARFALMPDGDTITDLSELVERMISGE